MTSLAFMFEDVPAPPWMTSTTNCSLSLPFMTSVQACLDGGGALGVEQSELVVGAGGGQFHGGQPADQVHVGGQRLAGDGEVLHGPEGVDAPVGVGGNVPVTEEVVFGTGVRGGMGDGHGVLTGLR